MDAGCSSGYELDDMAAKVGIPVKAAYTLREVAEAANVPYSTLVEAVRDGRLTTFLPPGRTRGRLVKPEWFEDYWEKGVADAG